MRLEFHPEARAEARDAAHWYEDRSSRAGDGFVKAMRTATDAILASPERYRRVEGKVRVFRFKTYPYLMYFSFDEGEETVVIHAVMHEKRRPGYWRSRLKKD